MHVGDNAEKVLLHRQYLSSLLPKNTKIQWLDQVHGADVLLIDKYSEQALIADAVITRNKNIALAILPADCLPILLAAKDGSEVAAIHGGWKPLAKHIITNTINKMKTPNENVIAWFGPCIGDRAFIVGKEVRKMFIDQSTLFEQAFTLCRADKFNEMKYFANLALIAKIQLNALGINNITHLKHCTFSQGEYYSYRRENVTGRMATLITIN